MTTDITQNANKFGTFKGVFTPSLLTILGVIRYLRFGWVVSQAGLAGTIAIVLVAHVIAVTTGLSISSIATNRSIRTGGDYYMISRSLGLPIGGTIGLALFFALAFSTSLYIIGFSESLLDTLQIENTLAIRRLVGTVTLVGVTAITFFSTSLALRVQYFVLAAIGLSLVSLFLGPSPTQAVTPSFWFGENSASFETVFAVFFPAVTGFTAGVAMSGDLKDPRRAIPLGTMAAIGVGLLVYLAVPIFLAYRADATALKSDPMIWTKLALSPTLVVAGIFAATLSSALGSLLGAPRYLQALAYDRVVPAFFGKGYGPLNEPRIGTLVTFVIAEAGILVGELDLIARIITMFFLASYGFACLASGLQTWAALPSFRPSFRVPTWVGFLGAAVCLGVMFKLDATAMAGATVLMAGLFFILKRRERGGGSADIWRGFWVAVVERGLAHLNAKPADGKNWKPNVVVFGGDPDERPYMAGLAHMLFDAGGLVTYVFLLRGDLISRAPLLGEADHSVRERLRARYPRFLVRTVIAEDLYEGISHVAQVYGFSGLIPNTILMGWAEGSRDPHAFGKLLRRLHALDRNLLFLRYEAARGFGERKRLDIWWGGRERNGQLMILLGFFLLSSPSWRHANLRVHVIVAEEAQRETTRRNLTGFLEEARLAAELNVIVRDRPVSELIRQVSARADLVMLGLREPAEEEDERYTAHVGSLLEGLGSVLLVRASGRFDAARLLLDEE